MTQNLSTAVMQRRHEAPDSFDDFPTHPWATRALMEKLRQRRHRLIRDGDYPIRYADEEGIFDPSGPLPLFGEVL